MCVSKYVYIIEKQYSLYPYLRIRSKLGKGIELNTHNENIWKFRDTHAFRTFHNDIFTPDITLHDIWIVMYTCVRC